MLALASSDGEIRKSFCVVPVLPDRKFQASETNFSHRPPSQCLFFYCAPEADVLLDGGPRLAQLIMNIFRPSRQFLLSSSCLTFGRFLLRLLFHSSSAFLPSAMPFSPHGSFVLAELVLVQSKATERTQKQVLMPAVISATSLLTHPAEDRSRC